MRAKTLAQPSTRVGGSGRGAAVGAVWLLVAGMLSSCGGSSEEPPLGSGGAASCETIEGEYAAALDEATTCNPDAPTDECTERVVEGLLCSCPRYANPAKAEAILRLREAANAYARESCNAGIVCGPCELPTEGRCAPTGRCETVPTGRGCKVGGEVHASGEGGIPDPVSCNTCGCQDGELVCTEIYCPEPCPEGSRYGTGCAECGPVDQCLVVEHACFPACTDTCEDGFCSNGVCVTGQCG